MNFQYINNNGETKKVSIQPNEDYTLKTNWYNQEFGQEWEITKEQQNTKIIQQIQQIELMQQRALREALVYDDKTRLKQYEQQILNLRNQIIT